MIELDCRGMKCPLPVIELARIAPDHAGEEIAVATEDPAAAIDVPAWARMRGHEFLGTTEAADGTPVHVVRLS